MRELKSIGPRLLRRDFVRFCIVGASGFIINMILLKLFFEFVHLRIYIAQALAAEIALFTNFILHHNWTYKKTKSKKTIKQLLVQFHATSWVAILGSALVVSLGVNTFKLPIIASLVIASALALFWNFFWSKYIIWRNAEHKEVGDKGDREI